MSLITLSVTNNTVSFDQTTVVPVDLSGIGPTVSAIVWDTELEQGELFEVIPFGTTYVAPPATITDFSPYQPYVDEANDILYGENNPLVVYALADNTVYDGDFYQAGQQLNIYQWPWPPVPSGFTEVQPIGSASAYDTWQWDGTGWIAAPFPIAYTLAEAQTYLTSLVNANGAALVNNQLRNYSLPELFAAADVNALLPADSVSNLYPTVGDYQVAVDAETAPLLADIAAATAANQLYVFDPTVAEPAPYAP